MNAYITRVENWLKRPYKQDGNVIDWFLFLSFAAFIGWVWSTAIKRVF